MGAGRIGEMGGVGVGCDVGVCGDGVEKFV